LGFEFLAPHQVGLGGSIKPCDFVEICHRRHLLQENRLFDFLSKLTLCSPDTAYVVGSVPARLLPETLTNMQCYNQPSLSVKAFDLTNGLSAAILHWFLRIKEAGGLTCVFGNGEEWLWLLNH